MGETCHLCLQHTNLRESHVVPKFLWKGSGLIGKHKMFESVSTSHPHLSKANHQDGFKERLLCHSCEQKIGTLESYARKYLFAPTGPLRKRQMTETVLTGLDYRKFKLFQISLLWRMGISTLPYYAHVRLCEHADIMRKMLLCSDPGPSWQYGCTATILKYGAHQLSSLFAQPQRLMIENVTFFVCVISGINFFMHASSVPPSRDICQCFLSESGQWILFLDDIRNFGYLRPQLAELKNRCSPKFTKMS
jgi:hypothetical protein